ncbi:MAG: DNA cytosine methyltransferase [Desulfovibrio sp.]|jgi:DNA (cytosine-5)-methyltransferase 1|nr:DNA cytosine methyltransferase [Desulfovibrio sp.]
MGIIVDLFAGGGGASQGIFEALGRHPDAAVNHDPQAIAIHTVNHADTEHWCQDVWSVDPTWVSRGRTVDLLWTSPDCTHHSKAKGGPPKRDEKRRDLAMVISHKWVPVLKPRVLILENVEEFKDWGPCDGKGVPVAVAKGENFRGFVNRLRRYGYSVQWRELKACDYGAPTTRKRLFFIARRDKLPIVWPEPTHGAPGSPEVLAGGRKPWRTAAEIIDWSLPCPSIFATSQEIWEQYGLRAVRPLAEATLRRIARGIQRFVLDAPEPFIVNLNHTTRDGSYDCFRGASLNDPLPTITKTPGLGVVAPYIVTNTSGHAPHAASSPLSTITTGGQQAVVAPFLQHIQHSQAKNGTMPVDKPARTVTAHPKGGGMALIAPFLTSYYGRKNENDLRAKGMRDCLPTQTTENHFGLIAPYLIKNYSGVVGKETHKPLDTITAIDHHALVAPHLVTMYGASTGQDCESPLRTLVQRNKFALVYSFFVKYYGCGEGARPVTEPLPTATGRDRFALVVVVGGEKYMVADIGMRMLAPHELLAAQGFPPDYVLDAEIDGKKITKSAQIAMIGNSVCPPLAKQLVAANYVETLVKPKAPALSLMTISKNRHPNSFFKVGSCRGVAAPA